MRRTLILSAFFLLAVPALAQLPLRTQSGGTGTDIQGNLTGSPANVAGKLDLGIRSMNAVPSGNQHLNRLGLTFEATGQLGYDTTHAGVVIKGSLTGATSYSHLIELNHTNTSSVGDSTAMLITTNVDLGDRGAGLSIRNIGHADSVYIGVEGRTTGTDAALGIGIDVNRQFGSNNENNPSAAGIGILCTNWSSTASIGTCFQANNYVAANISPMMVFLSNGSAFHARAATAGGESGSGWVLFNNAGTPKVYATYSGTVTADTFVGALTGTASGNVLPTRTITSGDGLTGGGNLSADRTLAVGVTAPITVAADAVGISITTTNDGGAIAKQASTPGTQQTGNINVSGYGLFGGQFGIGTTTPNRLGFAAGDQVLTLETPTAAKQVHLELVGKDVGTSSGIGGISGVHHSSTSFYETGYISFKTDGANDAGKIEFGTVATGSNYKVPLTLYSNGSARMIGQFHASAYLSSATQSINSGSDTSINFNGETNDVGGMHDNSTNPSRMTVPAGGDGTYILSCGVEFAENATGIRQIRFFKGGATVLAMENRLNMGASNVVRMSLTTSADLAATNYVECQAYQDSSGALNINGTNAYTTWFTATKVN